MLSKNLCVWGGELKSDLRGIIFQRRVWSNSQFFLNFKTNFKGQKQRLSSNANTFVLKSGLKFCFEGTIKDNISEEGLQQFTIFPEF